MIRRCEQQQGLVNKEIENYKCKGLWTTWWWCTSVAGWLCGHSGEGSPVPAGPVAAARGARQRCARGAGRVPRARAARLPARAAVRRDRRSLRSVILYSKQHYSKHMSWSIYYDGPLNGSNSKLLLTYVKAHGHCELLFGLFIRFQCFFCLDLSI